MERKGRKNELADPQLPAIRSIADGGQLRVRQLVLSPFSFHKKSLPR